MKGGEVPEFNQTCRKPREVYTVQPHLEHDAVFVRLWYTPLVEGSVAGLLPRRPVGRLTNLTR